jgi:hypothetical protein
MDFAIPAPAIAAGLCAAAIFPCLLVLLSHRPLLISQLGARLKFAAAGMLVTWLSLSMILAGNGPWPEVLCGGMIVLTAFLAGFSFWTLLAHGFTVSMLVTLAGAERSLSRDEWMSAYGGAGAEIFTQDRLGVLFRLGMVVESGGILRPTTRGRVTGTLAHVGHLIFNIDSKSAT